MKKTNLFRISVGTLASLVVLYLSACAHRDDSDALLAMDEAETASESDMVGQINIDDIVGVDETYGESSEVSDLLAEYEEPENMKEKTQELAAVSLPAPEGLVAETKAPRKKIAVVYSPKIPVEAVKSDTTLFNRYYFVRKSDTPHSVSQLLFGNSHRAKQIFQNAGGASGWKVGAVIYYQSTNEPSDQKMRSFYTERSVKSQTYQVKKGEQLSGIAAEMYGSEDSWTEIAAANRLQDPTNLEVGQTLVLAAADLTPYNLENWELATRTSQEEVKKFLAKMEKMEKPKVQQASAGIGGFLRQNWLFVGSVFVIAVAALLLLVVLPKSSSY